MAATAVLALDLEFQGRSSAIAAYLVRHSHGAALIECGPGSCQAILQARLSREGLKPSDITHVLLTHIHLDHAGAAGWWSRQGAEIVVHPVGAPHLLDPARLLASAARIYGERMDTLWGEFLPVVPDRLRVAQHEQQLAIGGLRFTPINTPGHANHHFAYILDELCFSGDIGGVRIPGYQYLRVPMPPPELHLGEWRDSLAYLRKLRVARIAPTHFGIYDDPDWQLEQVQRGLEATESWLLEVMPGEPSLDDLRQLFAESVANEAAGQGLTEDVLAAYELANPLGMSADGLMRYWKKYGQPGSAGSHGGFQPTTTQH
jgi:glyoxylase-like metal-dependent hydrolase (beta-lactamase superfamily II)